MKYWLGHAKGINLGGWLFQGSLEEAHLRSFVREEGIKRIASWGFDRVRLSLDYENLENEKGEKNPFGYEVIHQTVFWCKNII